MREDVVRWAAETYGPRHAQRRVSDRGFAFWVDTNSDGYHDGHEQQVYGGQSVLVLKRTGGFWHVGSDPWSHAVYTADTERRLRRAMKKVGLNPKRPAGTITPRPPELADVDYPPPSVTHERLVAWLRVITGWRHLESRIVDLGWAFSVSTQPDEYHDGNTYAMTYGNGPMIVVKHNGAAWRLASTPDLVPAFSAATEDEFWRILADAAPYFDRNNPPESVPH